MNTVDGGKEDFRVQPREIQRTDDVKERAENAAWHIGRISGAPIRVNMNDEMRRH